MSAWSPVVFLALIVGISATAADVEALSDQSRDTRIVSGWAAREGQFPYMLYLRGLTQWGDLTACGGSVIHARWGMTSARCVARRISVMVRAGSININRPEAYRTTSTYFTHPDFIDEIYQISQPFDVGLMYFNEPLVFSNNIRPIRLQRSADMDRDYSGVVFTTSGWGTMWDATSGTPDNLQWVHLVGVSNLMCLLMYNNSFLVRSSSICAGPFNVTSQGLCTGDSGVPLTVVDIDGSLSLVGVGSFVSQFGCSVGVASGFVRPGYFHDWIRTVTGINFDWVRSAQEELPTAGDHVQVVNSQLLDKLLI